uniref:uncharacterized protein KIAA1257 homolog n=1 Tax=Jaculus jaculus TaxID=51337 RepID=UPI001E1B2000|nr:uncharacterized protein KIAA1257 homolog [Jaculus jaculus]
MSLQAWEWEDVERSSMEPISPLTSAYQSASDNEMEEYLKDRAGAQDWDSDDHYTSSLKSSGELARTFDTDEPQVVPCKLIISLALPAITGHKGKHTTFIDKYKKHPKPDSHFAKVRRYYHIEYFFLPGDAEPQRVDIVVFPYTAKVFLETEMKTVKPWQEGDKVWVSWSQTFNVNMTKELLKKINFHKITMRLWDTKDKIAKKARYYQLKSSTHYEETSVLEEAKTLVLSQKKLSIIGTERADTVQEELHLDNLPGHHDKAEKYSKSPQESHFTEFESPSKISDEFEKSPRLEDVSSSWWSTGKTPPMSLTGVTMTEIKDFIEQVSLSSFSNLIERQKSQTKGKELEGKKRQTKKRKKSQAEEETDPKLEAGFWKHSVFSIQLGVMPLLAGS